VLLPDIDLALSSDGSGPGVIAVNLISAVSSAIPDPISPHLLFLFIKPVSLRSSASFTGSVSQSVWRPAFSSICKFYKGSQEKTLHLGRSFLAVQPAPERDCFGFRSMIWDANEQWCSDLRVFSTTGFIAFFATASPFETNKHHTVVRCHHGSIWDSWP